jgi:hypothetical protein
MEAKELIFCFESMFMAGFSERKRVLSKRYTVNTGFQKGRHGAAI